MSQTLKCISPAWLHPWAITYSRSLLRCLVVILNLTFPKANPWLPGHKLGLTSISPVLVNLCPTTARSLRSPPEYFPNRSPSLYLIPCYSKLPPALTWPSVVVSQLDFLLLVYSISFHLFTRQPQVSLIHKSHVTLLTVNLQWLPITLGLKPKIHETL